MIDIYDLLEPQIANPRKTGIFSDLDGTLSEIAPTPDDAIITGEMRSIIKRLAGKYAVVSIVSGRDSNEAKKIVGLDDIIYIGNHGLEWLDDGKQFYVPEAFDFYGLASNLAVELAAILDGFDLVVEKKKLGVAIHYRQAQDKKLAKISIKQSIKPFLEKYSLKSLEGRYVIELKPDLNVNKGEAVTVVALRKGLERALYLGDDVTDVDAFRAFKALRSEGRVETVSIAVASDEAEPSIIGEADYVVQNVGEVQDLLNWLAK